MKMPGKKLVGGAGKPQVSGGGGVRLHLPANQQKPQPVEHPATKKLGTGNSGISGSKPAPTPQRPSPESATLAKEFGIRVVRTDVDTETGTASLIIRFTDLHGTLTTVEIPRAILGDQPIVLRRLLASKMFPILPPDRSKALHEFLSGAVPTCIVYRVGRSGWHGREMFLCGNKRFGRQEKVLALRQDLKNDATKFGVGGDQAGWNREVGHHCQGNPILMFAASAAAAAPILDIGGFENLGIYFYGPPRIGKTTAIKVAFSMFGGGEKPGSGIRSADMTLAAAEPLCAVHCDLPLCLDEMFQAAPETIAQLIFALGNPTKRRRATQAGTARREADPTRILWMATGNAPISAYASSPLNRHTQSAASVRLLEIPAVLNGADSAFERIPERFGRGDVYGARKFADHLNHAVTQHFGWPGSVYIKRLVARRAADEETLRDEIRRIQKDFVERVASAEVSPLNLDIASRFGIVAAGGILAARLGALPWREESILDAVETCYRANLAHRSSTNVEGIPDSSPRIGSDPNRDARIIQEVAQYILDREETLHTIQSGSPNLQPDVRAAAVGFLDLRKPQRSRLLLKKSDFDGHISRIGNRKRVLAVLRQAGLLIRDEAQDRDDWKTTIAGHSPEFFYWFDPKIMDEVAKLREE